MEHNNLKDLEFLTANKATNSKTPGKIFTDATGYSYKVNDLPKERYFNGEKYTNGYTVTKFINDRVKGKTIATDVQFTNDRVRSYIGKTLRQYVIIEYLNSRGLIDKEVYKKIIASMPKDLKDKLDEFLDTKLVELLSQATKR